MEVSQPLGDLTTITRA